MFKRDHFISQLCGVILIVIGLLDIVSFSFHAMVPIKHIFFKTTPDDIKHTVFLGLFVSSLIAISFSFSFIFSGIGVLRSKEWARKLSLWTLGLHILIVIPVAPGEINIGPAKIVLICISISIIYLLSKKSIKEQFKRNKVSSAPEA